MNSITHFFRCFSSGEKYRHGGGVLPGSSVADNASNVQQQNRRPQTSKQSFSNADQISSDLDGSPLDVVRLKQSPQSRKSSVNESVIFSFDGEKELIAVRDVIRITVNSNGNVGSIDHPIRDPTTFISYAFAQTDLTTIDKHGQLRKLSVLRILLGGIISKEMKFDERQINFLNIITRFVETIDPSNMRRRKSARTPRRVDIISDHGKLGSSSSTALALITPRRGGVGLSSLISAEGILMVTVSCCCC